MKIIFCNRPLSIIRMLSCFTFIVGIIFMVFMMIAEDEPGALLLFLVFCGLSEMAANEMRLRKKR